MTIDDLMNDLSDSLREVIDAEVLEIILRDQLAYNAELRFYELMDKKEKTSRSRQEYLAIKILPIVMSHPSVIEYNRQNANSN